MFWFLHTGVLVSSYLHVLNCFLSCRPQELRPKGLDIRQEELGDLVDKEMAATSAAIEEAVRRIDVGAQHLRYCIRRVRIQQV